MSTDVTLSHALRPQHQAAPLVRRGALLLAATGVMAICAHLSFPLPFSPVPITMQTFGVLLLGVLLGPAAGFAALSLYLLEGALGLPVFSPHGAPTLAHLGGPSAGYLLSYPFAAFLAGWAYNQSRRALAAFPAALLAGSLALLPIFTFGAVWLSFFLHHDLRNTLAVGVLPFLPGEGLKLLLLASLLETLRRTPSPSRIH